MKKYLIGILIGMIVTGLALAFFFNPHALKKENDVLKVQIGVMKTAQAKLEETVLANDAANKKVIAELQGHIDSDMTVIAEKDQIIAASKKKAADAEAQNETLRAEVQPVIDANPKLAQYVGNFQLIIASQKDEILALTKKGEAYADALLNCQKQVAAQVKTTEEYKGLWESEKALRLKVETRLSLQDKRVAFFSLTTKLATGAVVVAVVVVILSILHK